MRLLLLAFLVCSAYSIEWELDNTYKIEKIQFEPRKPLSMYNLKNSDYSSFVIPVGFSATIVGMFDDMYVVEYRNMLGLSDKDDVDGACSDSALIIEWAKYSTFQVASNVKSSLSRKALFDSSSCVHVKINPYARIHDDYQLLNPVGVAKISDYAVVDWYRGRAFHVSHRGIVGWVDENSFSDASDINGGLLAVIERSKEAIAVKERTRLIKRYGKANAEKILAGKIWLGMSDGMARESWGDPKDINRSVGSWGVHEQWVYGLGTYLYFENGKLTSWQD